jgi:acetate kinase
VISGRDSRLPVYVVPTDEELMIARHSFSLLSNEAANSSKQAGVS